MAGRVIERMRWRGIHLEVFIWKADAAAAMSAGLNASTHANVSKGRKQSVILEARGQPASNIYRSYALCDRRVLLRARAQTHNVKVRCGTGCSQYADPVNPETWHHYELHAASLVISCGQVFL